MVDPSTATAVTAEQAAALLRELAGIQMLLVARLATNTEGPVSPQARAPEDRLLTPQEAAARLGVTVRWFYRHADNLPFTRRLSPRTLRFSEGGIARYLAQRRS